MKNASPLTARIALVLAIIGCAVSFWNAWHSPSRQEVQNIVEAESLRAALQEALDENDHEKFFALMHFKGFESQIDEQREIWEPIFQFEQPLVEIRMHNR